MKIAILHMTLGLADRGSETVISMLAESLSKKNQVMVYHSGKLIKSKYKERRIFPLTEVPHAAPRNNFDKILFRLGLNDGARKVVKFTLACVPELLKFKPDIVIAVNGGSQVKIIHHHLESTKIIVFGHAGIGHDDLGNLNSKPDLFIALSPTAKEWALANKKGNTQIQYLPNPIDLSKFKVKPIDLHLLGPTLLVVGALTSYKNILPVIKVASSLSINLVLIGNGEQEREVADTLSHYEGEFRWIKHAKPSDMPAYYKSADAFAFVPDSQEAFGLVYLEAMAAGLPIVATDDQVRREIIGSKGIYVKVGDGLRLQKAISYALSLPKMDYREELKEYDLKMITTKLQTLFDNL